MQGGGTHSNCAPLLSQVCPPPATNDNGSLCPLPATNVSQSLVFHWFYKVFREKLSEVAGGDVNGSRGAHTQTVPPPATYVPPPCHISNGRGGLPIKCTRPAFKNPLRKLHYQFTTFPSFATYVIDLPHLCDKKSTSIICHICGKYLGLMWEFFQIATYVGN